jgi:hypothetical protein
VYTQAASTDVDTWAASIAKLGLTVGGSAAEAAAGAGTSSAAGNGSSLTGVSGVAALTHACSTETARAELARITSFTGGSSEFQSLDRLSDWRESLGKLPLLQAVALAEPKQISVLALRCGLPTDRSVKVQALLNHALSVYDGTKGNTTVVALRQTRTDRLVVYENQSAKLGWYSAPWGIMPAWSTASGAPLTRESATSSATACGVIFASDWICEHRWEYAHTMWHLFAGHATYEKQFAVHLVRRQKWYRDISIPSGVCVPQDLLEPTSQPDPENPDTSKSLV